jgi:argininosuccinate lyase
MEVHRDRMLEAARTGFSTCSELADEIFRQTALPHRLAHSIVAKTVTRALEKEMSATDVTLALVDRVALDLMGRPTGLTEGQVQRAMDPVAFVESHDVPGGPAPQEVARMAGERRERLAAERGRQTERRARLQASADLLDQAAEGLIAMTL